MLYYHHTGYPGGQKTIKARLYLENDPQEMVWRSIKGMLPKNKMRREYMKKVEIIAEGGHNYQKLGLPQFGKAVPIDYNKVFGTDNLDKENTVIVGSSLSEKEIPPQMKELKQELQEDLQKPKYMVDEPKFKENTLRRDIWDKYMKKHRYRQYRNLRNKSYRYI